MVKVAGTKQRLAFLMGVATDVGESCSDGAKGGLALRISTVVQWIIQQLVGCKTTGEKTGMVPKKCQFPFVYDSVGILKERSGFPCSFLPFDISSSFPPCPSTTRRSPLVPPTTAAAPGAASPTTKRGISCQKERDRRGAFATRAAVKCNFPPFSQNIQQHSPSSVLFIKPAWRCRSAAPPSLA